MILLMILLCFWLFCLFPTAHPLTIDDLLATHGKNHTKGNHTKSDHHHLADPYHHTGDHARGAERFYKTAHSLSPDVDKVTRNKYSILYGRFLVPMAESHKREGSIPLKFLDIGLDPCSKETFSMSIQLWQNTFGPNAEIGLAIKQSNCALETNAAVGKIKIAGDQNNSTMIKTWVNETGGGYLNIIVDNGASHSNKQTMLLFNQLWPTLSPGGLYFIEEVDSGHTPETVASRALRVADIIQRWIDQLTLVPQRTNGPTYGSVAPNTYTGMDKTNPLPSRVEFIACQLGMCLIVKCGADAKYCSS